MPRIWPIFQFLIPEVNKHIPREWFKHPKIWKTSILIIFVLIKGLDIGATNDAQIFVIYTAFIVNIVVASCFFLYGPPYILFDLSILYFKLQPWQHMEELSPIVCDILMKNDEQDGSSSYERFIIEISGDVCGTLFEAVRTLLRRNNLLYSAFSVNVVVASCISYMEHPVYYSICKFCSLNSFQPWQHIVRLSPIVFLTGF